jgi:hydroxymethylglutaryl-CoA synthase
MINFKKFSHVGIVGYGAYVPKYRISTEEIARTWGKEGQKVGNSLGVDKKAIADWDEDCLTMAVEASLQALAVSGIDRQKIGACFVGSESFPYAVKPTGTILAQILGLGNQYFCADLQFACKAGTAGIQIVAAMIEAGMIEYGLAVGADKSQGKPGDALEYTAGSAAGAYLLGRKESEWLAQLENTCSFSSDTPDFWRRNTQSFPSHAGRFTGEPAYFRHITASSKLFFEETKKNPSDFSWVVFHAPNKKFPTKAAKILGFTDKQIKHSLLVEEIGNPYSASSLVSLANVLDHARAKEAIFVTSYGSGAGSDSFAFRTTSKLSKARNNKPPLLSLLKNSQMINYAEYLRKMEIVL